jgi:lipid II:glycine glycyltransferase (peptidoglycan interpeptide bridge formation enzyme)
LLKCREDWSRFSECLTSLCGRVGWKYVEIRPARHMTLDDAGTCSLERDGPCDERGSSDDGFSSGFTKYQTYKLHRIDLRYDLATLFNNFHKSCIRRKIGRAEREGLEYEAGRSESNLTEFYRMLVLTRRRQGLPPQPMAWFRNLRDCFGEGLTIHIASKNGRPIGAVFTLLYKGTLVYKYGCSEAAFHSLGAMPMLFWKAIQSGKHHGAQEFDLGRSDMDNPGVSAFKQHLGASGSELAYFRLGGNRIPTSTTSVPWRIASTVFTRMPGLLAQMAGSVLYRHMG